MKSKKKKEIRPFNAKLLKEDFEKLKRIADSNGYSKTEQLEEWIDKTRVK